MTFRPNPPKPSKEGYLKARKLYEKGYYWEENAKKLLLKRYGDNIIFLIKSPYAYPFDLIAFVNEMYYNIWLIEVRYR
jgi:hypothetical protein